MSVHSCQKKLNISKKDNATTVDTISNVLEVESEPNYVSTFSLPDVEKIEIISYPDRQWWDTIATSRPGYVTVSESVVDGKLMVKAWGIKDRVVLDEDSKILLYKTLDSHNCPEILGETLCFNPRHNILFYNSKGKIISYIEICFQCSKIRVSESLENKVCENRVDELKTFFKEVGVKYFGVD